MDLWKFTFCCFTCILFQVNSETNDTNFSNETSDVTELSLCETFSNSCYPHSTELTTDFSFSSTGEDNSPETKRTTVVIDNSTSLPPTTTPEIKKRPREIAERNCPCDVTPSLCDINCCCDNDCNTWEQNSFSACIKFHPRGTFGQCMTTDIIYRNNTPYPTTRSVSGLLCIAKDNFPERNAYIDQEVVRSVEVFERIWKRKTHYYWLLQEQDPLKKFEKSELYKYGDILWKYMNSTGEAFPLEFPASAMSGICQRQKSILYLKNFNSTCLRISPKTEEECIENNYLNMRSYCEDLIIIASPTSINSSMPLAYNPDEVFVKAKILICQEEICNETSVYPEPIFDQRSNSCGNVLKEVHLTFYHNGSFGISHAVCRITLYTSLTSQGLFEQNFQVKYLPAHLLNTSLIFHRSGTPGYRTGMPVLIKSPKLSEIKAIPLTVVSGKDCASSSPVLFQENMRIQCVFNFSVNLTSNCTILEEHIINRMLKGIGEVGVTGDPDSWLETPFTLIAPTLPGTTCKPVSSLSLDFLYSYRGTFINPEAKIVGLMSRFDGHKVPACSLLTCSVRLVTLVSFTDISRPVMSKYASAPVVKIKLPKDFFYPFSSSTESNFKCSETVILSFIVLHFLCKVRQ